MDRIVASDSVPAVTASSSDRRPHRRGLRQRQRCTCATATVGVSSNEVHSRKFEVLKIRHRAAQRRQVFAGAKTHAAASRLSGATPTLTRRVAISSAFSAACVGGVCESCSYKKRERGPSSARGALHSRLTAELESYRRSVASVRNHCQLGVAPWTKATNERQDSNPRAPARESAAPREFTSSEPVDLRTRISSPPPTSTRALCGRETHRT